MVGGVLDGRVLLGTDPEWLNGDCLAGVRIEVAFHEPRRIGGRARILPIGIEAVDAGQRAVFVVERAILVEDNEYVFDLLSKRRDVASGPFRTGPAGVRIGDEIGRDVRWRIGLSRDQKRRGGKSGLREASGDGQCGHAVKHAFHASILPKERS
jgi:hypothetical protein